jgi:hypothetical protein
MVKRSFSLTVDGKTYRVEVVKSGVIAVDGNVFNVEIGPKGVRVNGNLVVSSLSADVAVVSGKLYETQWKVD